MTAKSIVTKEVPKLARVSGVPATVKSYRTSEEEMNYYENEEEECSPEDLDCRINTLYENYFVELDDLVDMQLCLDSGSSDCWDTINEKVQS